MKKARILIIEDEVIIALQLEEKLKFLGYEVTSIVNNAGDAIKKSEEDKPDLILMDIRIQGNKDGIETAEIIRNKFGIPVIFSTAYLDEERIERAKITMPFGYVLKPIQERDLKVTLEMALYVAKVDGEKKKAERETEKLNQTLEAAQDMAKVGYWSFNIEKYMPTWSKQMFTVFGINPEKGTPSYDDHKKFWHPDDWDMFDNAVQECTKGKPYNIVVRIGFSDSTYHYINIQGFPRYDEKGDIVELFGTSQDITQFKLTEESLRESEEKYRLLFENSGLGIGYYKKDGTAISINKGAMAHMAGNLEDLSGRHLKEIFGEEVGALYFDRLKKASETSEPLIFEDQVKLPTGDKHFKLIYNRVCNLDEDVTGVQIIADDISEAKLAEQSLRESEDRLKQAQKLSKVGHWDWFMDSGELVWSAEVYEIFGQDKETFEVTAESFEKTIHPEDVGAFIVERENALAEDRDVNIKHRIILTDGSIRYVHEIAEIIRNENDEVVRVMGVVQDITDRIEDEIRLNLESKKLAIANRALQSIRHFIKLRSKAENELDMLHGVCQIVTEICGYPFNWIGLIEADELSKKVHPVASAGFEDGYLETVNVTWADVDRGRGPTGKAIREGKPIINQNIASNPDFALWREEAHKRGYASSIALPLILGNKTVGALNIYAAEEDAFDAEEVDLLNDLTTAISNGIAMFRKSTS